MAKVNKRALGLGMQRSVIRELFEFGKKRIEEAGEDLPSAAETPEKPEE